MNEHMRELLIKEFQGINGLEAGYRTNRNWFRDLYYRQNSDIEKEALTDALTSFQKNGYIQIRPVPNMPSSREAEYKIIIFTKEGVKYIVNSKYEKKPQKQDNSTANIGVVVAQNVQIGSSNTIIENKNETKNIFGILKNIFVRLF